MLPTFALPVTDRAPPVEMLPAVTLPVAATAPVAEMLPALAFAVIVRLPPAMLPAVVTSPGKLTVPFDSNAVM
jgi:hypothetical protein